MKGKIFIILIMVGIPAMAWVTMLTLGALHSAFSVIPALSFLESFLVALALFSVVVFVVSLATDNTRPTRRHRQH
ncbi:MAG: hypothetical protein ACFNS6_00390 [Candidatus Saccharimonas sp.]